MAAKKDQVSYFCMPNWTWCIQWFQWTMVAPIAGDTSTLNVEPLARCMEASLALFATPWHWDGRARSY
jgi:hypothetical protein